MKFLKLTYSFAVLLMFSISAFSLSVLAQERGHNAIEISPAGEYEAENFSFMIEEENYSCFRDIQCLRTNRELQEKGLNVHFDSKKDLEKYILKGDSQNEKVYAEYNQRGTLMKGHLVHLNVLLPKPIVKAITSDKYKGWSMIGNEKIVRNFDARTTQYKVILQNNSEGILLYFDRDGNQINPLASM